MEGRAMENERSNMTSDLVKELRFWNGGYKSDEKMKRAADRIEKLEAALREIAALGFWDGDSAMNIARKALEGKDE
jgi:benzoyl-CoA reductase/2-hydroxyglutaryl-CoA dehydratase subunit BcrC/BadD/HgdB